jgi:ADP-ribose pyrophosphatase
VSTSICCTLPDILKLTNTKNFIKFHKEVEALEWEIINSKKDKVHRFEIVQEDVILPNKEKMHFSFIDSAKAVCILPITVDGKVVCIRQYRHSIKKWQWELPAGAIDSNDVDPLLVAKRELEEEAGYKANNWILLDSFYPSVGSTSEEIFLYVATDLIKTEQRLETTEQIELYKLDMKDLIDLISSGDFQHGAGIAVLLRYFAIKKQLK